MELLTIDKILMTVDGPGGDVLSVVTYTAPAGGCGIARNGAALPEFRWPVDQIEACTAALLRLAGVRE
jgi:hypothetical protein